MSESRNTTSTHWHNCDVVSFFQRRNCSLDIKLMDTLNIASKLVNKYNNIKCLIFKTHQKAAKSDFVLVVIFPEYYTLKNTTYTILCKNIFPHIFKTIAADQTEVCFLVDQYTSGVYQQIKNQFKRSVMINRNEINVIHTHDFHRSVYKYIHSSDACYDPKSCKRICASDIICKTHGFYEGDVILCEEFPTCMNCGTNEYYIVVP